MPDTLSRVQSHLIPLLFNISPPNSEWEYYLRALGRKKPGLGKVVPLAQGPCQEGLGAIPWPVGQNMALTAISGTARV